MQITERPLHTVDLPDWYLLSISDDDICSDCGHCQYNPGGLSGCTQAWPAQFNDDNYAVKCVEFVGRK